MSTSNMNTTERARLQNFFARLVSKDFHSLAQELPPSPTKSWSTATSLTSPRSSMSSEESAGPATPETRQRALSTISNSGGVAIAEEDHEFTFEHSMHDFESLEDMKRMAADAVAASQKKFQPLPANLRPRKMSTTASESAEVPQAPRSPKKPRMTAQSNGRKGKDGAYEATGVSDDPFARVPPRRTRGPQENPRGRMDLIDEDEDKEEEDVRPASLISEALVLNFVREMHERSQVYSADRELDLTGLKLPTMFPSSSFAVGETMENAATLQDRPMKRQLPDWTLDLDL